MIIEGIFNACHNAPLFFSSSETSAVKKIHWLQWKWNLLPKNTTSPLQMYICIIWFFTLLFYSFFSFVDMMPDGNTFIIFCFLIRIVSALGAAATQTASLTLVVQYFHDNISPAMVSRDLNTLKFINIKLYTLSTFSGF